MKSVVVTGASTGIGWGIAKVLLARGFRVTPPVADFFLRGFAIDETPEAVSTAASDFASACMNRPRSGTMSLSAVMPQHIMPS